jgi:hypothetical protein
MLEKVLTFAEIDSSNCTGSAARRPFPVLAVHHDDGRHRAVMGVAEPDLHLLEVDRARGGSDPEVPSRARGSRPRCTQAPSRYHFSSFFARAARTRI